MSKNEIRVVRQDSRSKVVVVTPLLPGHKISKETKKTIQRNDLPFTWIHSIGENNIPTNVELGLDFYLNVMKGPKAQYILPLDRDIVLGRHMIDKMYDTISKSGDRIAYVYANFKFEGTVNIEFKARPFDIESLLSNNFISSNSMIKINALQDIGGFVIDEHYKRLLDWALFLKFLDNEYFGEPCPTASFIAISSENDVSAGTNADFHLKKGRVFNDFVKPILKRYVENDNIESDSNGPEVLSFEEL